jgi:hypothetical protein
MSEWPSRSFFISNCRLNSSKRTKLTSKQAAKMTSVHQLLSTTHLTEWASDAHGTYRVVNVNHLFWAFRAISVRPKYRNLNRQHLLEAKTKTRFATLLNTRSWSTLIALRALNILRTLCCSMYLEPVWNWVLSSCPATNPELNDISRLNQGCSCGLWKTLNKHRRHGLVQYIFRKSVIILDLEIISHQLHGKVITHRLW